jgi:hypothetical protein
MVSVVMPMRLEALYCGVHSQRSEHVGVSVFLQLERQEKENTKYETVNGIGLIEIDTSTPCVSSEEVHRLVVWHTPLDSQSP